MSTGEKIRQYRDARSLTQDQLGKTVGVMTNQVSRLETDKALPTIGGLYRLSVALGCNMKNLVGDDIKAGDGGTDGGSVPLTSFSAGPRQRRNSTTGTRAGRTPTRRRS
jgi:transcriptional regulator with XRE-family HTH domain